MTAAERYTWERGVLAFAGPLAQRRSKRHDEAGWALDLWPELERAIHEAGHAIAAAALGSVVHELSIVPRPDVLSGGGRFYLAGFCLCSAHHEIPQSITETPSDHVAIAGSAWLLTPLEKNAAAPHWTAVRAI